MKKYWTWTMEVWWREKKRKNHKNKKSQSLPKSVAKVTIMLLRWRRLQELRIIFHWHVMFHNSQLLKTGKKWEVLRKKKERRKAMYLCWRHLIMLYIEVVKSGLCGLDSEQKNILYSQRPSVHFKIGNGKKYSFESFLGVCMWQICQCMILFFRGLKLIMNLSVSCSVWTPYLHHAHNCISICY